MSVATAVERPATASSALAVAVTLGALALLVDLELARFAVALEGGALLALAAGLLLVKRSRPAIGAGAVVLGIAGVGAAIAIAASLPRSGATIAMLPGLVGAVVLTLAITPLRGTGSPGMVKLGCGLVLLSTITAGALQEAGSTPMLLAGAATIVAWDLADNAISLGRQLGRDARTLGAELSHALATATVAAIGVGTAHVVTALSAGSLSFSQLLVVLLGVVVLLAAVHD